jgi:hypothetical protein
VRHDDQTPGHLPRDGAPDDAKPARQRGKAPPMILVIDNYDSFVYNLVHYVEDFGVRAEVVATMR